MKQRCQSALYKIIFLRTPSSLTPCCAPSLVSAPWPEFEAPSTLAPSRPRRLLPPPPPPHCTPTVLFTRHHHTRNFHSLAFWLQCPPSHFLSHKLPFILQIWLRSVETSDSSWQNRLHSAIPHFNISGRMSVTVLYLL